MKFPLSIICLFTALTATAFSSAKWLEERGDDSDVMRLRAAYAECVKKLEVPAEKVRVEQFKEDGSLFASLDAESCVVDRKTKSGWVEGAAQMVYGDSSVKGRGIYFSLEREFIKIFSQSEIRTGHTGFDRGSFLK